MDLNYIPLKKRMYLLVKAVESAQNGIIITNKEGNIVYANPYFTKLTGFSEEEILGKNPRILKSEKHDKEFYEKMWKQISSGKKWTGTITNKNKKGYFWKELLTITPITDENDTIEYYIGIQQSIDEEHTKKDQTQRIKLQIKEIETLLKN
jgi:two-component system, cell cycle sensor histidine kinase and response regulator CckA